MRTRSTKQTSGSSVCLTIANTSLMAKDCGIILLHIRVSPNHWTMSEDISNPLWTRSSRKFRIGSPGRRRKALLRACTRSQSSTGQVAVPNPIHHLPRHAHPSIGRHHCHCQMRISMASHSRNLLLILHEALVPRHHQPQAIQGLLVAVHGFLPTSTKMAMKVIETKATYQIQCAEISLIQQHGRQTQFAVRLM